MFYMKNTLLMNEKEKYNLQYKLMETPSEIFS